MAVFTNITLQLDPTNSFTCAGDSWEQGFRVTYLDNILMRQMENSLLHTYCMKVEEQGFKKM